MPRTRACYLPVENIELLSKYGHEEGLLDRLGGGAWQAKKAKLKERIREMADRLIRIAAERALRSAPVLEPEHHAWEEFSARFPYQETDDQLRAIQDVMADLEAGHADGPADLWRCGLWQDRGGDARGFCRGHAGDAGGGDRAHDLAGAAALPKLFRSAFGASRSRVKPLSRFVSAGRGCENP